ncbi:MAG: DUF3459 domain-containing protein, partial [Alphaproteobacteria bacterium]|nr:DUF3459 domain-containing protein [Alphaproteobacteria bacterium]
AEYTRGRKRLHMAYSFDMLGAGFSAAAFRRKIESFYAAASDGWPCWSFSNHDVVRHVSRWAVEGQSAEPFVKLCIAMLASFEGTIGIYLGEELGQLETWMDYHELTDCEGLSFWPEIKGRDGCRTPMVWDAALPNAGFSVAEQTWLPIKPPQAARAAAGQEADPGSVLHHYRKVLAFRRHTAALREGRTAFLDLGEPVLAFRRGAGKDALLCVFNLSSEPCFLVATGDLGLTGPHRAALGAGRLELPPLGFAWLGGTGDIAGAQVGR